jgi:bifunctional UDP-N-acetylglucosamine pyrophosphorylase/glucosamine-1-phosphate N-acetyltransferase
LKKNKTIKRDNLDNNYIINTDTSNLKSIGHNNTLTNCKFVGDGIEIGNNCTLKNVIIGSGTYITDSYIEDSLIGKHCKIGPFSRIRPNSNIGDNCKIGNFVEIKNSQLGEGVKAGHLAYIGDAIIGDETNIGCGVIFANYNGVNKNISIVGKNCFIGSNVNIIAPVKIKDNTYVCAGTTITENTEEGDFVIGRVKAESKKKYSYYLKNKRK